MYYVKRYYIYVACLGLCLGACSDDDRENDSSTQVVASFNSNFGNVATRVTDTGWSENDEVGIYMVKQSGGTQTNAEYAKYKPTTTGTSLEAIDNNLYYPLGETKVGFVAFAPYKSSYKPSGKISYSLTSQATKEAMGAVDFIYCNTGDASENNDKYFSSANPNVTLKFEHKLSKVIINLSRETGVSQSLKDFTARINSLPTSAICNPFTGEVEPGGPSTYPVSLLKTTDTESGVTFELIVAPHITTGTRRAVEFLLNGTGFATQIIDQTYESGHSYTYNFTLSREKVVLKSTTISPWKSGEMAWDGQYVIRCGEPELSLFKESYFGQIMISTNYSGNLTGTAISGTNWLSIDKITRASSSGGYYYYTIDYRATANSATSTRFGTISVLADKLMLNIPVSQSGATQPAIIDFSDMSNCYIVPPGGSIVYINAGAIVQEFNNKYCDGVKYNISGTTMTADVLWSDVSADGSSAGVVSPGSAVAKVSVSGTGALSTLRVTSGRMSGNAVVAFRSPDGVIRWSFHIWVTDYKPNIHFNTLGGTKIMDRNLGATSADPGSAGSLGLLYQWGRKDPFPSGSSADSSAEAYVWLKTGNSYTYTQPYAGRSVNGFLGTGRVTVAESIKYPFRFYAVNSSPYDWCATEVNDAIPRRWKHLPEKSIDDPCPAGYKVRLSETYNAPNVCKWTNNATWDPSGYGTENGVWYPAAGRRAYDDGRLLTGGGAYWCNARYTNGYAYFLFLIKGSEPHREAYGRSHAMSVRCGAED